MTSTEHRYTPGPWKAITDRRNAKGAELPPVVVYDGTKPYPRQGAPVATINVSDSMNRYGNARLIAAAPELLAALKALDAACRKADAHECLDDAIDGSLLDAARAAIEKAKGGAA